MLDARGKLIYFPSFSDSIDDILYEIVEWKPSNELVVEVIFENIKDASTRDEALKLYDSDIEETAVPVIGVVHIPFKLAEVEAEKKET
jgi:hypothetical protein